MEDRDIIRMLDSLVVLTSEEQDAADRRSEELYEADKAERKRLAAQRRFAQQPKPPKKKPVELTPEQIRRKALREERERLLELANRADIENTTRRIEKGPGYKDMRRSYAEHKKLNQKRKKRSK